MIQLAQARPPFIRFELVAVDDVKKTNEVGYRVTKDVERVFVMQGGSRDENEIDALPWIEQLQFKINNASHDAYPQEWVNQIKSKYEAWKKGHEIPVFGTHVRECPLYSPAQVKNFIALNILTAEDVAAMTEEALQRVGMGGRELREKTREWLSKREATAGALKENEELKIQIAALTARLDDMEKQPKRGRPPKLAEAA